MTGQMPIVTRRSVLAMGAALPLISCSRLGPVASAPATQAVQMQALSFSGPGGRVIPVTEWKPAGMALVGTILFSHGAALAPNQYLRIVEPLAAAGWHILAPLHTDSEQHPDTAKYRGFETWRTRIEDMRVLSAMVGEQGPIVAAGHSYGGLTALVLGGAQALVPEGIVGPLVDPKVAAVLAFSPPPPIPGFIERAGYATLAVPALIQTGTLDVPELPGMGADGWIGHLAAYDEAPSGQDTYALVLEGVDHYFGGAIGRLKPTEPWLDGQLGRAVAIARLFAAAYGLQQGPAVGQLKEQLNPDLPVRLLRK